MTQQVKDLALSLLWLLSLLWHGFNPWSGNFPTPRQKPKEKKKKSNYMTAKWPGLELREGSEQGAGMAGLFGVMAMFSILILVGFHDWPKLIDLYTSNE